MAFDSNGNLYIADNGNNRIRKVGAGGVISTVAGNGNPTFAGDGGYATNASLRSPSSVTFDISGNFYIADFWNQRIRKVTAGGIITTVAGNGTYAYSGDNGQATNASLYFPWGVAIDKAGNLFIADWSNNRVRKVASTGIITTVAGNGSSAFSGDGGSSTKAGIHEPTGMTFDTQENLLIAESQSSRVRKIWYAGIPSLTLSKITAADAGNYSVIVSNSFGSVTGAVSTLTVILPPMIPTYLETNKFSISWAAMTGLSYQVQYKTNLNQPTWANFGAPISTVNNSLSITDSVADPVRFYRVKLSP